MARVLKREAAKRDLMAQWVWYSENADAEVADRFLRAVETTLLELASQPGSGIPTTTAHDELLGIRRFPVSDGFGKVLLFYMPLVDGVDLVRAVHGHREMDWLLSTGTRQN